MNYAIQTDANNAITASYSGGILHAAPWIAITAVQYAQIVPGSTWSGTEVVAPVAAAPTAAQQLASQAAALIAGGLEITSTGTAALNGTYNVQNGVAFGQQDIATEAQFISTFSEFTNGTTTALEWPLLNGTMVTFTTTGQFLSFAKAAAVFVAAIKGAVATSTALPANTAMIP